MKKPQAKFIIISSALVLFALLGLQIYWVINSAKIKEEQFNQKVSMLLCKVADEICSDASTCSSLDACCMVDNSSSCKLLLSEDQKQKIDSVLSFYMDFYNVKLNYQYDIYRAGSYNNFNIQEKHTYDQRLNTGLSDEYQLRLILPGQSEYIRSSMTGIFISSVILILILIGLFWKTVQSLLRNSMILERTTDFVNNMTHELRTPVANISLASSRLLKEDLPNEKRILYTTIVKDENERLRIQIERLLDLNHIEQNEVELKTSRIDIHQLLNKALKPVKALIDEKGGSLSVDLSSSESVINGDELHLCNAFSTLLDNAIKYSKEKPLISIRSFKKEDQILIEIEDKGIGISPPDQKKIFEKFYRVTQGDVHNVKGFGIGLAYAKKMIELHKGSIEVRSNEGEGSVFIVTLPLANE